MAVKTILAGNWKMNLGPGQASELASALVPVSQGLTKSEIWLAPAAVSIAAVHTATNDSAIRIGAQNIHWEESGAFTGELSIAMLREVGCTFTLVGHSERRHVFGETDEMISKRALFALAEGFTTIYCIGESLEQRESGKTESILRKQLQYIVPHIGTDTDSLVIAYEPVWAIGTGKVATTGEIEAAHQAIEAYWNENHTVPCPPILYGGSVNPDNFAEIVALRNVSGGLVGGASLSFEKFHALVKIAEQD